VVKEAEMDRREMLKAAAGLAAGATVEDKRPKERLKRLYRGPGPDGRWREIGWPEVVPGETVICVGLDGGELWCLEAWTVGPKGYAPSPRPDGSTLDGCECAAWLDIVSDWPDERRRFDLAAHLRPSVLGKE
jgi:hypothetical protein